MTEQRKPSFGWRSHRRVSKIQVIRIKKGKDVEEDYDFEPHGIFLMTYDRKSHELMLVCGPKRTRPQISDDFLQDIDKIEITYWMGTYEFEIDSFVQQGLYAAGETERHVMAIFWARCFKSSPKGKIAVTNWATYTPDEVIFYLENTKEKEGRQ